jgi:hypothetical protein
MKFVICTLLNGIGWQYLFQLLEFDCLPPRKLYILYMWSYLCFHFYGVIGQFNSVAIRLWFWTEYLCPREYRMSYKGPGFLAVGWFGSSPKPDHPLPLPPVSKLSLFLSLPVCRRRWWGRGGERSQIIWQQESLVLYKSFNALCSVIYQLIHCNQPHTPQAPSAVPETTSIRIGLYLPLWSTVTCSNQMWITD